MKISYTHAGLLLLFIAALIFLQRNWTYETVISKPSRVTDTLETKVLQITEESGSPKTPSERVANARQECLLRKHQYNRGAISLKRFVGAPSKLRPRFFISNQHKILICNNPKCGSTQWRKLLVQMDYGRGKIGHGEYMELWTKVSLWNVYNISTEQGLREAERAINDYARIVTVREPLERLVSAYNDKVRKVTGKMSYFQQMSRNMHVKYGNNTSSRYASFGEFVDFILDESDPANLNPHFKPYSYLCDPCSYNFDMIAKLETIQHDVSYITEKLHFQKNDMFANKSNELNKKWTTKYHDYYKQLTQEQRQKIFQYYKAEYDYFGYPYPNYI